MHAAAYPDPTYAFEYRKPPTSGSIINGLGEESKRRARVVFHSAGGDRIAHSGLETLFQSIGTLAELLGVLRVFWLERRSTGALHPTRSEMEPSEAAAQVKNLAKSLGAVAVGVTEIKSSHIYEGHAVDGTYAISIAASMDRESMRHAPSVRSVAAAMDTYREVGTIAVRIAEAIRASGWAAETITGLGSKKLLHVPVAVDAGLGELGKHGSLITRDAGSNVRLATVVTELPLQLDEPVDLGVQDVCAVCRVCTDNCPPGAISTAPVLVRGVRKWFVDFDRCAPYFVANHSCGICIEVCPWSESDAGGSISERVLKARARKENR